MQLLVKNLIESKLGFQEEILSFTVRGYIRLSLLVNTKSCRSPNVQKCLASDKIGLSDLKIWKNVVRVHLRCDSIRHSGIGIEFLRIKRGCRRRGVARVTGTIASKKQFPCQPPRRD